MPQSVVAYLDNNLDFEKSDIEKRDILNLYRNDIKKAAKRYNSKVSAIFENIPAYLSTHEKKSFSAKSLKMPPLINMMNHFFGWMIL